MKTLIAFCLLIAPVCAQSGCGGFVLAGEGLYLKPCTDNLAFVTVDDREYANKTTEEWGYTALLGYVAADNCSDLRITWSRLTTHDSRKIGQVSSLVEFDWRNFDAALGVSVLSEQDCPFVIRLIGGVRYTRIEFQRRLQAVTVVRSRSEAWGVGPRAGFYTKLCLGCGYGLFGQFDLALLVGRIRAEVGHIKSDRNCQLFPTVSIRLGGDYTANVGSGSTGRVTAGIQITRIFSAIERLQLASQSHLISPLDLLGFFIGAELSF